MALDVRGEIIIAKQIGPTTAIELIAELDDAYGSGGDDNLSDRGVRLLGRIIGHSNSLEVKALMDADGDAANARIEEIFTPYFGSTEAVELIGLMNTAYTEDPLDNVTGFSIENSMVTEPWFNHSFAWENHPEDGVYVRTELALDVEDSPGEYAPLGVVEPDTDRVTATDLTPDTTYWIRYRAEKGDRVSEWGELQFTTDSEPPQQPEPPTDLVADNPSDTTIDVNWTASETPDVDHYRLEISLNSEPYDWSVVEAELPGTGMTVTDLEPETDYIFRAFAVKDSVDSEPSNTDTEMTLASE